LKTPKKRVIDKKAKVSSMTKKTKKYLKIIFLQL